MFRYTVVLLATLVFGAPIHAGEQKLRLAVVNTPQMSGLIGDLIADFKASGGVDVAVYSGSDVYERARGGEADIVISHYGAAGVESFVLEGFGEWPRTVFSNQHAIIGPKTDPAGIKGMTDATQAMKRIADAKALFVANQLPGLDYLAKVLWAQAGAPEKGDWYLDPGVSKGQALKFATEKQAYTLWGVDPFLRFKKMHGSDLELLVTADPMLQRIMAVIIVRESKVTGVNTASAKAFQTYLLSPRAQARVSAFRTPGVAFQTWWPAGRHNSYQGLEE